MRGKANDRDTTLNLSPVPTRRDREFSQIRQDHTYRPKTSNYNASKKQGESRVNRSFVGNRSFVDNSSRVQDKNSKYREQPENSRRTQSPVKKLCVGCFNKELGEAKKQKHRRKQIEERKQKLNMSVINYAEEQQARSRYYREKDKVNQYNLQQIEQNKLKRDQQKLLQQKNDAETLSLLLQNKQQQYRRVQLIATKMQQLRKDLIQQIQAKKLKHREQVKQQKLSPMRAIFCQPNRQKIILEAEQKYRRDLSKQINENRAKKQSIIQQQNKRKRQQQLRIMVEAVQADRVRKQYLQRQQKQLQQEAKYELEQKRRREQRKRQQEQQQKKEVKQQYFNYKQQMKRRNEMQRQKLDEYLASLKKQMTVNELKKKQEYSWIHEKGPIQPFIQKVPPHMDCCDDCEKAYPDSYLTKVIQPIRL